MASVVRILSKSSCGYSQRIPHLALLNQQHQRLLLRSIGSVPNVSAVSAGEAMTATTAVTLPTQPRHLAFQSMAEGSMNDLHSCIDPCIDVSSGSTTTSTIDAAASTTTTVDPIRREAALQVDKMERERLRILQEVAASMSTTSGSGNNNGDHHVPFCVATEEGTLTDLVVLDRTVSSTLEGTTTTTDPMRNLVSPPSPTKIRNHDHDHHQAYQATFDDRGALFFDLDTYESSFESERDYQTALEHETERQAALEHDKMKRKEQSILQHASSVSSSAGPQ